MSFARRLEGLRPRVGESGGATDGLQEESAAPPTILEDETLESPDPGARDRVRWRADVTKSLAGS